MPAVVLDDSLYASAGVDVNGNPIRLSADGTKIKDDFKRVFRIIDEQDAVNRYKWYNLPCDLSSEEVERMIYYKGSLAFFYLESVDKFFFMPYALDGTIDAYGRFNQIKPVPLASGADEKQSKKQKLDPLAQLLSMLTFNVVKAPKDIDELKIDDLNNSAVLLYDYTKQLSQTVLSRQSLNEAFLDMESEILPYMQTALLAGTGVKGMRVNDADAAKETEKASKQIRYSALTKKLFVAMTSSVEFQELADGSPMKTEEFLLGLQGVDNMRKASLGIENGGIFQKKAHKLESEQAGNESSVATVFQDGLSQRQHFCNIVNSIWGLDIWCEPAEAVVSVDLNGDGVMYDRDLGEQGGMSQEQESAPESEDQE